MMQRVNANLAGASARRMMAAKPVAPKAGRVARSVAVRAMAAPLVGSAAPDFKAQAVVDQEFVEVRSPASSDCSLLSTLLPTARRCLN